MVSTARNQDFDRLLADFVLSDDRSFEAFKRQFSNRHLHHLHEQRFRVEAFELLNRPSEGASPHIKHLWNVGVLFLLRCMFFAAPMPTPFVLSLGQLAELALAVQASRLLSDDVSSQCIRVFFDLLARGAWLCSYPSLSSRGSDLLQLYDELAAGVAVSADMVPVHVDRYPFEEAVPETTEVMSLMDEFHKLFESTAVIAPVEIEIHDLDAGSAPMPRPVYSAVPEIDSRFRERDFIESDLQLEVRTEEYPSSSLQGPESGEMSEEIRYLEQLEQHAEEILVSGLMKRNRRKRTTSTPVAQQPLVLFDEVGTLNAPSEAVEVVPVKRTYVRKRKRPRKSSGMDPSSMQSGLLALEELEAQTRDLLTSSQ